MDVMQTLNLSRLHLTGLDSDVILGLPLLHSVDLRQNYLSYLHSEVFNNVPSLTSLYLAGKLLWVLQTV